MSKRDSQPHSQSEKLPEIIEKDMFERIEFVIEAWGRGYRRRVIIHLAMAKFKIQERTAYRDFERAEIEIIDFVNEHKHKHIGQIISTMDTVIRKTMASKNFTEAINASKLKATVLGLTNKVELSGKIENNVNLKTEGRMTDAQLAALGQAYADAADGIVEIPAKPKTVRKGKDKKG